MAGRRSNREDIEDQRRSTRLFLAIAAAVVLAGALLVFFGFPILAEHLEPGVGMKQAAVAAFIVTLAVFIVMAIAAGDGLLGEFQYMLAGFGGFFVVLWLLIAWIF
ncbi:MAG: hypothetical protein AB7G39_10340 [Alphaproteobacteria bacterium]